MKRNSKSVLSGKGFYIALALSVAMVGAACYFAYTQTSDDITGQLESTAETSVSSDAEREAANVQTDIPKATTALTENVWSRQTETKETTTAVLTTTKESETQAAAAEAEPNNDENEAEETAKPQERNLSMPIDGEVMNEFSGGELVKSNTTGAWQTHNGIDIKATIGDAVTAADSGTVSEVKNDPLWGVTVTIDHGNGIISRYCNLNTGVTVQTGQEVSAGEEIGAVGDTADIESSEETHLHFEVTKNGSYTNPLELI